MGDVMHEAGSGAGHGGCLNCGAPLVGRYCHACGHSSHVHRTLGSIVHDLAHGVFHFEGKIWRTLPMLVRHPGELTRRYIHGERARFVSPLALFLFTVFLMFATFSTFSSGNLAKGVAEGWSSVEPRMAQQLAADTAAVAALERRRATLATAGQATAALNREIVQRRAELTAMTRMQGKMRGDAGAVRVHSHMDWVDHGLQKARENPGLVLYKVQSAAYKLSWVLILLSTPFVALLFVWRRGYGLYDHATFVTYSISFMSLLAIVLELLLVARVPGWVPLSLLVLVPPAHMFRQLQGAYLLGWWSAAWRTAALLFASLFALIGFAFGVLVLQISG